MSQEPINPLIHLNGTGQETLKKGYDHAADKLEDFIDAWGEIEFNARDYYPLGNDAFPQAQDERCAMSAKIREVRDYLQRIREHLYSPPGT